MIGTRTMNEQSAPPQEGATAIEAPDSGLGRYAKWQLKDFMTLRAPFLLLLAVLMMYPLVAGFMDVSPSLEDFAREMRDKWLYFMTGGLTLVGTLIGTRGIVAEDRQQGYHRFLFSKPVGLARYYAQAFGVVGASLMAVLAVVGVLYSILVAPVALLPALVPAAVFFVLFGGVTFLFSTLSRYDWVLTIAAVAASAWTRYLVVDRGWAWLTPLKWVLLPLESFGRMVTEWAALLDWTRLQLETGGSLTSALASTAWPLAYGLAAFGAGLWILRKRSLTQ